MCVAHGGCAVVWFRVWCFNCVIKLKLVFPFTLFFVLCSTNVHPDSRSLIESAVGKGYSAVHFIDQSLRTNLPLRK